MLLELVRAVPALTLPTNGIGPRGQPTPRIVLNDSWPEASREPLLGHNAAPNTLIRSNAEHTATAHIGRVTGERRLRFSTLRVRIPDMLPADTVLSDGRYERVLA